jgi:recombination protein RecA
MSIVDVGKLLANVAVDLNKEFKARVAVTGDELCASDVPFRVPTRSFSLNKLLGGGAPIGRVVEVFGDPSHGKSTILEEMMIGFQRFPGISVLLDADTGWCRPRAIRMGHDSSRHLHLQADTVEYGFETIFSTIARLRMPGRFPPAMPIGIFWDTISASQTEGEKEGDKYKEGMGDKPRKIRENLRRLAPELPRNNVCLVFACHTHAEFGKGKSQPQKKSSTGGEAIPFWAAKRIKVWISGRLNYPTKDAGVITTARTIKDKLEAPNLQIDLPILHNTGIDPGYELLLYLIDHSSWVNMSGAYVNIPDYPEPGKSLSFYPKQFHNKLQHFPDLMDYLWACAEQTWDETHS